MFVVLTAQSKSHSHACGGARLHVLLSCPSYINYPKCNHGGDFWWLVGFVLIVILHHCSWSELAFAHPTSNPVQVSPAIWIWDTWPNLCYAQLMVDHCWCLISTPESKQKKTLLLAWAGMTALSINRRYHFVLGGVWLYMIAATDLPAWTLILIHFLA